MFNVGLAIWAVHSDAWRFREGIPYQRRFASIWDQLIGWNGTSRSDESKNLSGRFRIEVSVVGVRTSAVGVRRRWQCTPERHCGKDVAIQEELNSASHLEMHISESILLSLSQPHLRVSWWQCFKSLEIIAVLILSVVLGFSLAHPVCLGSSGDF